MPRAFVTGSTGFLGRHLIATLLAHGWQVTALVRTFDRARQLPNELSFARGDITKPETLRTRLTGADALFHLAAWHTPRLHPRDHARMVATHGTATHALFTLAAELGVPKLIYTADLDLCAPDPLPTTYLRTKAVAFHEIVRPLQAQGLPITALFPGTLYGPDAVGLWAPFLRRLARRRLPLMLGGTTVRAWTHVADAAEAHRHAAELAAPAPTYAIAGPRLTVRDFFTRAAHALSVPPPALWLPNAVPSTLARICARYRPHWSEMLRAFTFAQPEFNLAPDSTNTLTAVRSVDDGLRDSPSWFPA